MAEPENHTLRLLQDIREVLKGHDRRFESIDRRFGSIDRRFDQMDTKLDLYHSDLKLEIEALRRMLDGEATLTRFAALGIEERLESIEKRLATLEEAR